MTTPIYQNKIKETALVLVGPTACGKTALALRLAKELGGEIVSVDSMQVYRGMDIGTAKPTPEERADIPHHLIDIVDPDDYYNVSRFVKDALKVCLEIKGRGRVAILTGGTGLYLRGLTQGVFELDEIQPEIRQELKMRLAEQGSDRLHADLSRCDPASAARIHPHDTHRLLRALEIFAGTGISWSQHLARQQQDQFPYRLLKIGLSREREELYQRIDLRVGQMLDQGLVAEVERLLAKGYAGSLKSMQSIGYRHMVNYLSGDWSWEQSLDLMARDTRRYAKRQYTWFRRDPEIVWFHPAEESKIVRMAEKFII